MSYTHFTLEERECLLKLYYEGKNFSRIAKELGRHRSTIKREIERNFSKRYKRYNVWGATCKYIERRKKSVRKLILSEGTDEHYFVLTLLRMAWPPEVIAHEAKRFGMKVSASTIYRAIKRGIFGKNASSGLLRRRGKRLNKKENDYTSIKPEHTIHDRPESIEKKENFGDWEGDTLQGAVGKGGLVTFVDRKSKLLRAVRYTNKRKETIYGAFLKAFESLEDGMTVNSITLDNGSEFAEFKEIERDLGTMIYFADPHSPWQRGLNENTNGLLRFFFPKGTNFLLVSDEEVQRVVDLINMRPRKALGYLSPVEFFTSKCCN